MKEFGIVVFDLNGGDLAVHFVDGTRWNQILVANVSQCSGFSEATQETPDNWKEPLNDLIGWLTCDDRPETDPPVNAPERRGALLKTVYTQRWVFEPVEEVEGRLLGILTL